MQLGGKPHFSESPRKVKTESEITADITINKSLRLGCDSWSLQSTERLDASIAFEVPPFEPVQCGRAFAAKVA
jgi:hypothetical protein